MMDIAALKRLLSIATPGEWEFSPWHVEEGQSAIRAKASPEHWIIGTTSSDANAECIAALHNAAPELIAKAEENAALRAECNHLDGQIHELLNENAILSKTVETLRAELELQYQALAMRSGELQTAQSRLRAAEEALRKAADQFEMYAQLHQAKGEAGKEKALVNWRMEVLCRSALTEQEKA